MSRHQEYNLRSPYDRDYPCRRHLKHLCPECEAKKAADRLVEQLRWRLDALTGGTE